MRYLLDTNICIYIINERPRRVLDRFIKEDVGEVGVSTISVADLAFGIAKTRSVRNNAALNGFLLPLEIAPFDSGAAHAYGEVRAALERRGKSIGPLDTLIAAHALSLKATLVTNNVREFRRVAGLPIENWAS